MCIIVRSIGMCTNKQTNKQAKQDTAFGASAIIIRDTSLISTDLKSVSQSAHIWGVHCSRYILHLQVFLLCSDCSNICLSALSSSLVWSPDFSSTPSSVDSSPRRVPLCFLSSWMRGACDQDHASCDHDHASCMSHMRSCIIMHQ